MNKMKKPKNLKINVATKLEALWMQVRDVREHKIKELEDSLIVEKEVLKLAKILIQKEK